MPWYDYHCDACDRDFEAQQTVEARDEAACPHCASSRVRRTMPRIAVLVRAGGADEGCACGEGGCGCCAGLN